MINCKQTHTKTYIIRSTFFAKINYSLTHKYQQTTKEKKTVGSGINRTIAPMKPKSIAFSKLDCHKFEKARRASYSIRAGLHLEPDAGMKYFEWFKSAYSGSSRERPPREFEKVVVTRADRLQEYDPMVKQ